MAISSRQIGWGTEENLLWQISKQLEQLTGVTSKVSGGGGGGSYLRYVATINQSGVGDPVPTVLENTLGADLVWTRSDIGDYYATIATPDFFTIPKTILFVSADAYNGNAYTSYLNYFSPSSISLTTFDSGGGYGDFNTTLSVEIRVYP